MSIKGLGAVARKHIWFSPACFQGIRTVQSLGVLRQLLSLDLWTAQSTFLRIISKVCDSVLVDMWYGCHSHDSLETGLPHHTQHILSPIFPEFQLPW